MPYTGQVTKLPVGMQGFSGSRNPSQLQPGHLIAVEGLSLDSGIIQKEGGASKLNATALTGTPVVITGTNWCPVPAARRDVIFTSGGKLLKDDGSGTFSTELATGLTAVRSPPPVFAGGGGETIGVNRKLFFFSSTNQVKVSDGDAATMASISGPAADWSASFPTFGLQHVARMWAGGNASDPHRMYASTLTDHEDFVGAGALSFPVFPAEGEMIVGALSFRGVLIIFKYPKGVYILDTRDASATNWRVDKLSGAVGAVNHSSIVQIENDIMYMDEGGNIHLLSATNDFGDVNTSNLSQIAEMRSFIETEANLVEVRRATAVWYAAKRQAWFSMPTLGNSDNDLRIIVDFNRSDLGPRFIPSRRDVLVSMWMRQEAGGSKPAGGDNEGFVWLLDRNTRNKDGATYPLRLETANTDLSFADPILGTKDKTGHFLEIVSEPRGNWELTVEVYWDDVLTDTVNFDMGVDGATLGTFILDTSVLTSSAVSNIRKKIAGSGRRIRLVIHNDGVDETVAVAEFILYFLVGDEKDSQR